MPAPDKLTDDDTPRQEFHSKNCHMFHPDWGPDYGCNCGGDLEQARATIAELRAELRSYRRPAPVSDEAMLERALAWLQNHGGTRAL